MATFSASVRFEEEGTRLTAVEIVRDRRSTVISALQGALFLLGVVVAAYEARPTETGVVERLVMVRQDGGAIDGDLGVATRAAILPLALEPGDPDAPVDAPA